MKQVQQEHREIEKVGLLAGILQDSRYVKAVRVTESNHQLDVTFRDGSTHRLELVTEMRSIPR